MTLPALLPDWIPWWAQLAGLVLALLLVLAFLLMPFAVFGLKGRLDLLEAQLDDIHAELRMLAMRLPDAEAARPEPRRAPGEPGAFDEEPAVARRPARAPSLRAPSLRADDRLQPRGEPQEPVRDLPRDRSEPRLRWPPSPDKS